MDEKVVTSSRESISFDSTEKMVEEKESVYVSIRQETFDSIFHMTASNLQSFLCQNDRL